MRKIFVLLALTFAFVSCTPNQETIITNKSNFLVSFQYSWNDASVMLNSDESVSIDWHIYSLVNLQPGNRVSQYYDNNHVITINNLQSYEVYVDNRTANPVTLTAGGWMDDMVNIQPGWMDDENHKGRVYTNTPTFYVPSAGFPLHVQSQFNNSIFYVVIRE